MSSARTEVGRQALSGSPWVGRREDLTRVHEGVEEVLRWERLRGGFPLGGVEDIRPWVGRAARGGVLEAESLRSVRGALQSMIHLAGRLAEHGEEYPTLAASQPDLALDGTLARTLERAFDPSGQLSGRAYPQLQALRDRVQDLHRQIREVLEHLVGSDDLAEVLQDRFVTQRGDRYVLPVKANANRKAVGIVHGVSQRGQTLFIEPHEVVERNNALRIAEAALEEAEQQIYRELSGLVGVAAGDLERGLEALTWLDGLVARAALSARWAGTRPVVGEEGVVRLKQARHPLLAVGEGEVVANDLGLDADHPILVVSGPNTGGKTVVLKTLGLCVALTRMGVFPPVAEGSRCDWFDVVHAVLGDSQDVQAEASTFSGHLRSLSDLLRDAGPGTLGLVDEIAGGTDPSQGAAVAASVLEAIADRGARALVTTHLGRLKAWALEEPRAHIGGMSFVEGRPSYRMIPGVHGESHALEIARREGLAAEVVDRAAVLLHGGDRTLARSLEALEQERARVQIARRETDELREELAARRAELEAREAALEARVQAAKDREAAAFAQRLSAAERAVAAVVADLQRAPDHGRVEQARKTIEALQRLAPSSEDEPVSPTTSWEVGDRVRLPGAGGPGQVVSVGSRVTVRTDRGLQVQLRADQLVPADPPSRRSPPTRRAPRSTGRRSLDPQSAVPGPSNTLDLRGQRVDEGLVELERFLDRAVGEELGVAFVLHGHGTGALKKAVRGALRTHPRVASARSASADQGGDAYTVLSMKEA